MGTSVVRWLLCTVAAAPAAATAAPCRDPILQPFSSASIWNTPIGSGAVYAPIHLFNESDPSSPRGPPPNIHNDQDFFVITRASDPLTPWVDQGWWGARNHCDVTSSDVAAMIPFPHDWTSASDGGRSTPWQSNNNAMAILLPDNVTLVQTQPAYRCEPGGPLLGRWGNITDGCPQRFPNVTSILGDGALGAHGGSGLSGIGGTIRLGELQPDAPPIAHALKLELEGHLWYYGLTPLQKASENNQGRVQYVWPATGSDGGTDKPWPKNLYTGTDPNVAPGSLLAVPPVAAASLRESLRTDVGRRILDALSHFGGYLVDSTGGLNMAAICMEAGVNLELRELYNFSVAYPEGVRPDVEPGAQLYADLLAVFRELQAVTNNAPGSVGGGGNPIVPPPPPLCQ